MERPAGGSGGAAVAAVVVLVVVWVARAVRKKRTETLPPGPRGLPVVGNLFQLLGGKLPHSAMAELSHKYGPIVFLRLGSAPAVLISDCLLAKACLSGSNDKIFASRPPMEATRRLIFGTSAGIAMAPYGDDWRHARKLCSLQLFTARRVTEFEPFRRCEIVALMHKLKHQIETRKSREDELHVNLSEAISSLTEAITCRMLLGKPSMEIEDAELGINMQVFVQRITQVFQLPIIGDFIPCLGFLDGKAKAALDEIHAAFNVLMDNLVRERQQRPQDSPTVILDVLLENLDIDRAKTIMMELIVAAIDTSATTLDWAMAELMANPEAMRKLQEELDKVAQGEGRIIEEAELGKLEYMKAVVKETLRLHTPVPLLIPHMSTEECCVGGYTIPKGSRLLVNAWAIARDPKSWEEPLNFLPERFLSDKGSLIDLRGQHFEFLPFGSGRRSCPGLPLALPLIESALSNLVHTFDWHLPPHLSVDLSERFGTVVSRANPLYAIPRLRHHI